MPFTANGFPHISQNYFYSRYTSSTPVQGHHTLNISLSHCRYLDKKVYQTLHFEPPPSKHPLKQNCSTETNTMTSTAFWDVMLCSRKCSPMFWSNVLPSWGLKSKPGNCMLLAGNLFRFSSTLKMEAVHASEMSVNVYLPRHSIPGESSLHSCCYENLRI